MNKWHRKSKIKEQVEKEFQESSWMRFCKENNPDLYNRELEKVVHNRFLGFGGNKNSFGKTFKGHSIKRCNRGNFFYGN